MQYRHFVRKPPAKKYFTKRQTNKKFMQNISSIKTYLLKQNHQKDQSRGQRYAYNVKTRKISI